MNFDEMFSGCEAQAIAYVLDGLFVVATTCALVVAPCLGEKQQYQYIPTGFLRQRRTETSIFSTEEPL